MTEIREICKLSDQELEVRRGELSRRLASRIRDRRNLSDGMVLSFDSTPEVREELNAFVAFERECCPTLGFSISEASDVVDLEMRGLDPLSSLFAGLGTGIGFEVDAATVSARRWGRVLGSAGLGTAAVLPLTNLDNPWLISGSALVFSGGIWFWRRRRDVPRAAASAGGCGC